MASSKASFVVQLRQAMSNESYWRAATLIMDARTSITAAMSSAPTTSGTSALPLPSQAGAAGTVEVAWRACASFVGLSLRHPAKAENSVEEESTVHDSLAPACVDLVHAMLQGAGCQAIAAAHGTGALPTQSSKSAAALLLAALVYMAAGDTSGALPFALQYVSCRPADESGHALLASLCAAVLGEGVRGAVEQAAREEGCRSGEPFAHYLLHPLQCVVCCSPLRQPVTDSTGVSQCAACRAAAPTAAAGRGGRARSGSRSEAGGTTGRSSRSSAPASSPHGPVDTTVQALVDLAWPRQSGPGASSESAPPSPSSSPSSSSPYVSHGAAMEQASALVDAGAPEETLLRAVRALEAAPPSLWPEGYLHAASILLAVSRAQGSGLTQGASNSMGLLAAHLGIHAPSLPSTTQVVLTLYLRAMASAQAHALLPQHAYAAALASSGRQEIEGEAGRTVTVARARGRAGRLASSSCAPSPSSSLGSSGIGSKRARTKSRGSLEEVGAMTGGGGEGGAAQHGAQGAARSLLLDSDTATDILQWARTCIRALPLPGSREEGVPGAGDGGVPALHRACAAFAALLGRLGEAEQETAGNVSTLSTLSRAIPAVLAATLQPLLQALPAAVGELKAGRELDMETAHEHAMAGQASSGGTSSQGAVATATPASPGHASIPDAKRARVHGGAEGEGAHLAAAPPADAPPAAAAVPPPSSGTTAVSGATWLIRGPGAACSPAFTRAVPQEELATCLDCPLCYTLLYQPVTLPECQHTFCKECLIRCLDHKAECPSCRADLSALLASHIYPINASIDRVVRAAFPTEYCEKRGTVEAERREAEKQLPIFVCGLVLPHEHCPLHVFEPRYRLMMRRAMQSGHRAFGMAVHLPREDEDDIAFHALSTSMAGIDGRGGRESWQYSPVGVRVAIASMKLLPDGRSLIECTAEGSSRRYKVVQRGVRDGYNVGKVEWIVDSDWAEVAGEVMQQPQGESSQLLRDLRTLVSYVHALVLTAASGLSISHCSAVLDGLSRRPTEAEGGARLQGGAAEERSTLPAFPQQTLVQRARMLQLGASQFMSNWEEESARPPPCPPLLVPYLFPHAARQGGEATAQQPPPLAVAQALDVYLWSLLSRLPVHEEAKMRGLQSSSLRERVALVRSFAGTLGRGEAARQQAEDGYDEVGRLCGEKGAAAVSLLITRAQSRVNRCPWLSRYLPTPPPQDGSTGPSHPLITETAISRACDITVNVGHVMMLRMGAAGGAGGGSAAMLQSMLASLLAAGHGGAQDGEEEDGTSGGEGDSGSGTGDGSDAGGGEESASEGGRPRRGRGQGGRGAAAAGLGGPGGPGMPPGECVLQ